VSRSAQPRRPASGALRFRSILLKTVKSSRHSCRDVAWLPARHPVAIADGLFVPPLPSRISNVVPNFVISRKGSTIARPAEINSYGAWQMNALGFFARSELRTTSCFLGFHALKIRRLKPRRAAAQPPRSLPRSRQPRRSYHRGNGLNIPRFWRDYTGFRPASRASVVLPALPVRSQRQLRGSPPADVSALHQPPIKSTEIGSFRPRKPTGWLLGEFSTL
jgi:hypothetical protein